MAGPLCMPVRSQGNMQSVMHPGSQGNMHPGFLIFTVPYQTECAWLFYLMHLSTNPQATVVGRRMRALLFAESDLVAWVGNEALLRGSC